MRKRLTYRTYQEDVKKQKWKMRKVIQIGFLVVLFFVWFFLKIEKHEMQKTEVLKLPTMERLLEIAIEPVGTTMYIWGGGWDVEDEKSGAGSTRIGISPTWVEFAQNQDASYNYEEYRYQRELGLDCSGYVGWVVYNLLQTENGKEGYVTFSTEMAETFANRGWGKLYKNPKRFCTGDIVSMDGHVWICLGTCKDGSVLLVHSSPPGVSICGTEVPNRHEQQDEKESIAIWLAETFMEAYFPKWQNRYPNRSISKTYLENVMVMRWNVETLSDSEIYQEMSGEEVMAFIKEKMEHSN